MASSTPFVISALFISTVLVRAARSAAMLSIFLVTLSVFSPISFLKKSAVSGSSSVPPPCGPPPAIVMMGGGAAGAAGALSVRGPGSIDLVWPPEPDTALLSVLSRRFPPAKVSLDWASAGCGVLFIVLPVVLFRDGDADSLTSWSCEGDDVLFLFPSWIGVSISDGGVVNMGDSVVVGLKFDAALGDSGDESTRLKTVGLGDGCQPTGLAAFRSSVGQSRAAAPLQSA